MIGEVRNICYVGREMPEDLRSSLVERRWSVDAIELHSSCNLARAFGWAGAGIIDFSGDQIPQDLSAVEQLLGNSHVVWVATGYPEQIQ